MPLSSGSRLGAYEVLGPLGAGGMGEVYRARDTRLSRDVAIKILPELFALDPERLARFKREAQVLASLNHPNIGAIYGLEESPSVRGLVLELVEGPTLAEVIAAQGVAESGESSQTTAPSRGRGATERGGGAPRGLGIDVALPIAHQIVDALEAAHEQGIIHRDLKPANIKVRSDGTVKVLDFGLARIAAGEVGGASALADVSQSPTLTSPAATRVGVIVGTAAYMSPEQARGKVVDKRADIWAFGCVLYEMLTGTRVFGGDDVSDTLAAIIRAEPDWNAVPPQTHPAIRRLLRRCLHKNPRHRLADIADARLELQEAATEPIAAAAPAAPARGRRAAWTVAIVAATIVLTSLTTGTIVWLLRRPPSPRVTRFDIVPPQTAPFTVNPNGPNVAISSDGALVAYHIRRRNTNELELRRLDQLDSQPILGTEGTTNPVFSPDNSNIAFVSSGKLQKRVLGTKASITICEIFNSVGVSWALDDTIVFAQSGAEGGVFRVSADGGKPERIATPNVNSGEQDYMWPDMLPDGKTVLFTIRPKGGAMGQARIAVRSVDSGEQKVLIEGGSYARYVATGHLTYVQAGTLMAIRFDPGRREVLGSAVPVQEGIVTKGDGVANYSVARNGSLVYVAGSAVSYVGRFVWKDRNGKLTGAAAGDEMDFPRYARISPDGRRLAATLGPSNEGNIWIYDLRGASQPLKLTFNAHNIFATWTPDGTRVAFASTRTGARNLFWVPSDASVLEPQRLATSTNVQNMPVWSPDGQSLLYVEVHPQSGNDLWVMSATGAKEPRVWLQTSFSEAEAAFSPDSKWVAYVSDQTGSAEVWVRPFPGPGSPVRVSSAGGHDPVWSRDGTELFYQEEARLMTAQVATRQPELQFKPPRQLFTGGFVPYEVNAPRTYDVASDGRFLMIEQKAGSASPRFAVVLNWAEELKRLVP